MRPEEEYHVPLLAFSGSAVLGSTKINRVPKFPVYKKPSWFLEICVLFVQIN
jgi:hypothetical protein